MLRLAAGYEKLSYPPTLEANTAISVETIRRAGAAGIDLLCLSENFLQRNVPLPLPHRAMGLDHPCIGAMCAAAREARLHLVFSFVERADDGALFISAPLVGPDGRIIGIYRKNFLTQRELEAGITPGREAPVFDTALGRIGILICYDMWYPETAIALARGGAQIVCHPLAGDGMPPHWDHCWRARAIDHQVYLLSSVTGDCGGEAPSCVIAPDGAVLAQTRQPNDLAIATARLPWRQTLEWFSVGPAASHVQNVMRATRAMLGR